MNPRERLLILLQLVIAAAMTGIIWMVQCVTYPQFLLVGADGFVEFHESYTARMGPVVAPLMIAELGLALFTVWHFRTKSAREQRLFWIGAAFVLGLWGATFLLQVPLHEELSAGWTECVIRDLVAGNWIRTFLWSLRLALLCWIVKGWR